MARPLTSRARPAGRSGLPTRIVSGGQTGVDRAALDVALALGIPCGGWCPAGRWAEDGVVPALYGLTETESADPAARTRRNVENADGTLILTFGAFDRGTHLTLRCAEATGQTHRVVDLKDDPDPSAIVPWLSEQRILTLNVAGPRESKAPGIYGAARRFLTAALTDRSA